MNELQQIEMLIEDYERLWEGIIGTGNVVQRLKDILDTAEGYRCLKLTKKRGLLLEIERLQRERDILARCLSFFDDRLVDELKAKMQLVMEAKRSLSDALIEFVSCQGHVAMQILAETKKTEPDHPPIFGGLIGGES